MGSEMCIRDSLIERLQTSTPRAPIAPASAPIQHESDTTQFQLAVFSTGLHQSDTAPTPFLSDLVYYRLVIHPRPCRANSSSCADGIGNTTRARGSNDKRPIAFRALPQINVIKQYYPQTVSIRSERVCLSPGSQSENAGTPTIPSPSSKSYFPLPNALSVTKAML